MFLAAVSTLICAGTAQSPEPLVETNTVDGHVQAIAATPVRVNAMGRVIEFGDAVQLGQGVSRGPGSCDQSTPLFDSFVVTDTDGDGIPIDPVCGDLCGLGTPGSRYFFGSEFPIQGFAMDIVIDPAQGRDLESIVLPTIMARCVNNKDIYMYMLVSIYEDYDTTGFGYDINGDTIGDTPFPPDDLDGDTNPDALLGSAVLTFPIPLGGYQIFYASELDSLGIPLPSDGIGGIRVQLVDEFVDLDGDTVNESPVPFENTSAMLWAPSAGNPGCSIPSYGARQTDTWWPLGYNICNDTPGYSPDPFTYVFDDSLSGVVACPETLMPAVTIFGTCADERICADQNADGQVLPNDFTAWIDNYNSGDYRADVNQNGFITPTDFTAWIAAFNQGQSGPNCSP